MANLYNFFEYIKKYIFIVFVLFLSSFFQGCPDESVTDPQIPMYTVTFDSIDGSSIDSQSVKEGANAIEPTTDPTKADYEFLFWADSDGKEYSFSNAITNDLTLYAQWIRLYTVTFDPGGGLSVISQNVRKGSNAIKPNDPVRANYSFDGWHTNIYKESIYDFSTSVTNDLTVYAKWTLDPSDPSTVTHSFIVNFNDGVTPDQTYEVVQGDTLFNQRLLSPEHPDSAYDFYGWYATAAAEEGDEYDENAPIISSGWTIYAKWLTDDLEKIVYLKQIPVDLSEYDQLTRNVLSLYEVEAEVEARYVDDQAQGTGLGDKWANASDNLGQIITDITDASESKVYVVLVTGETHTPAATIGMKNHVAVIGGYDPDGSWERPPGAKTIFDGENQRRLFAATAGIDRTALFYDIEIYKGKGSIATSDSGYGMRLDTASPTLWKVIFNNNGDGVQSGSGGGLTLVEFSYPVLIDVEFRNNQVKTGGALFVKNSSIILSNVEFNNNKSGKNVTDNDRGGAMYVLIEKDHDSGKYPDMILDGVTFSANEGYKGGGLAIVGKPSLNNDILPITVKNVEFEDNTSTGHGGGVYIESLNAFFENTTFANNSGKYGGAINGNASSLVFVNTTFYNNEAEFGSVARMQNTEGNNGAAPHLRLINITAVDNSTSNIISGDLHITRDAEYQPSGNGGSTQLINSIFWDKHITDPARLIYVDNNNSVRKNNHELALINSAIGGTDSVLNAPGSGVGVFDTTHNLIDYITYGIIHNNMEFESLQDNGGTVKTINVMGAGLEDTGIYVKWIDINWEPSVNLTADFFYSENDSDWYDRFENSGLVGQIISLPDGVRELNYVDALGLPRVGRPNLGAVE